MYLNFWLSWVFIAVQAFLWLLHRLVAQVLLIAVASSIVKHRRSGTQHSAVAAPGVSGSV